MLTALFRGKKIISNDNLWINKRDEINEIAVCPQCKEPIICKFGEVKIHHFAHSHKANCPGSNDTLEHMKGNDLLYKYLKNYFGDAAIIDIEHCMENGIVSDFYIEQDNRNLIIEFYSGHLKKKDLKKKLLYYQSKAIQTIWLITASHLELVSGTFQKINRIDKMFVFDTGLDKYYDNHWYEEYEKFQDDPFFIRMKPRDYETLGSLNYLDLNDSKIFIARAIKKANHSGIFDFGKVFNGDLWDLKISSKNPFVYFENEVDWVKKCKEIDETKKINSNFSSTSKIIFPKPTNPVYHGFYRCVRCKDSFPASEMSNKRLEDTREGFCNNCV